jgi:hypothetical protein
MGAEDARGYCQGRWDKGITQVTLCIETQKFSRKGGKLARKKRYTVALSTRRELLRSITAADTVLPVAAQHGHPDTSTPVPYATQVFSAEDPELKQQLMTGLRGFEGCPAVQDPKPTARNGFCQMHPVPAQEMKSGRV